MKDFFYFTRNQRIAISILIALILLTVLTDVFLPHVVSLKKSAADSTFIKDSEAFMHELKNSDSIREEAWQQKQIHWQDSFQNLRREKTPYVSYRRDKPVITLFRFDPNTLDSAGFVALGIKSFIAKNIIKYRKAGGRFRTAEDFAKVYGLSPEKFIELASLIEIHTEPVVEKVENKIPQDMPIVDLNTADTTELQKVKGIGRWFAASIVRFRHQSGGFVSVEQLNDLPRMTPSVFNRIRPYCKVGTISLHTLRVNYSSVERLMTHPYLGFYKARDIYDLRRRKGKLNGIEELRGLPGFNDSLIKKLRPYLDFQ